MVYVLQSNVSQQAIILTKALKNAANYWGLTNKQLGEVIGLSEPTISRLKGGKYRIGQESKAWELSLLFLRAFRGLDAYMGGHIENEKRWLKANNHALGGAPLQLMGHIEGLIRVVQYIDYMRGK